MPVRMALVRLDKMSKRVNVRDVFHDEFDCSLQPSIGHQDLPPQMFSNATYGGFVLFEGVGRH